MTDQAGAEKAGGESADQPTHSDAAGWRLDEEEDEDEDEYLEVSCKVLGSCADKVYVCRGRTLREDICISNSPTLLS